MIAASGLRWVLTVLCTALASYGLWRALLPVPAGGRGSGSLALTARVTHLLHALMAVAMGAMAWPWSTRLPPLPQILLFSLAAVWFPATAALKPPEAYGRAAAALRSVPHAVAMGAMAWMVHAMDSGLEAGAGGRSGMAGMPGMDMSGAGAASMTLGDADARGTACALAGFFLLCALRWIARSFDTARRRTPAPDTSLDEGGRPPRQDLHEYDLACHGAMALGMAVMFVVMV